MNQATNQPEPSRGDHAPSRRRHRARWLVVALVCLLGAGGAILLWLPERAPGRPPGIQSYRQGALRQRTENAIHSISHGLKSYRQDFGQYPPSEPQEVKATTRPGAAHPRKTYLGGESLLYYLNGKTAEGYYVTNPRGGKKVYPPRVTGVAVGRGPGASGDGFLDRWDKNIEYFKADRRGRNTATIYPRAVAMGIRVGVARWLKPEFSDYRPGWAEHSVPVNAKSFLLVSPGRDDEFGTDDDIGNW